MATPRKHWFKVADSILRESWSDSTLATHVRLMAWLNQRWARDGIDHDKAGSAIIGAIDAMAITGARRPHVALQRLAGHPLVAGYRSASAALDDDKHPTRVTLTWPKFSAFQEYGPRSPGSDYPEVALSDSDSDSDSDSTSLPATPSQGGETEPPQQESDPPPKREARPPPERHPEARALAEFLRNELLVLIGWTPPRSLEAWEREFDRMLRLDGPQRSGIPPDQIRRVIRWVVQDPFESANVQSAAKLRKRFGQLAAKANGSRASPKSKLQRIADNVRKSEERERERQRQCETQDASHTVRALPEGGRGL